MSFHKFLTAKVLYFLRHQSWSIASKFRGNPDFLIYVLWGFVIAPLHSWLSYFIVLQRKHSPTITRAGFNPQPQQEQILNLCWFCLLDEMGVKVRSWLTHRIKMEVLLILGYYREQLCGWQIGWQGGTHTQYVDKIHILHTDLTVTMSQTQTHKQDLWKQRGRRHWFDLLCWVSRSLT